MKQAKVEASIAYLTGAIARAAHAQPDGAVMTIDAKVVAMIATLSELI